MTGREPELGEVDGGNLLGLLDLLLVGPDLALKLVHQVPHPLRILPVLLSPEKRNIL